MKKFILTIAVLDWILFLGLGVAAAFGDPTLREARGMAMAIMTIPLVILTLSILLTRGYR